MFDEEWMVDAAVLLVEKVGTLKWFFNIWGGYLDIYPIMPPQTPLILVCSLLIQLF
jgi:hypothetical protein